VDEIRVSGLAGLGQGQVVFLHFDQEGDLVCGFGFEVKELARS
jgi:hypothetical protein